MLSLGSKYSPQQRTLNKQLCGAVKRGDEREIRRLVREGADPSYADCDMLGFSALHHAVNTRQMKSLEVLQQLGGDVHLKDGLGWTLMHQVCVCVHLGLAMCDWIEVSGVKREVWG